MTLRVLPATADIVPAWLSLVREVEPLFGPMPNFEETLNRNIARGAALCAMEGETFSGGMLVRHPPHTEIGWLAVPAATRRRGAGEALVRAAIAHYAPPTRILVVTFREENVEGRPARRLYEKFGFVAGELIEVEGALRQRFRLKR